MVELDLKMLKGIVYRKVHGETEREDVFQQAWLLAQTRTGHINYGYLVIDAMRAVLGDPRKQRMTTVGLENPLWLASLYPTEPQLVDRWLDEETEDQYAEWKALPAADRTNRINESMRALGSSREDQYGEA